MVPEMKPEELRVFRQWLEILNAAGVPYLLGGAFAFYLHTGIWRDTKDMDVFLEAKDLKCALDAFSAAGYETEIPYRHWLAKVCQEEYYSDLLFGFWNGRLKTIPEWSLIVWFLNLLSSTPVPRSILVFSLLPASGTSVRLGYPQLQFSGQNL